MSVKQLRALCRDRRLECKGLRRPEIIELLSVDEDDDIIVSSDDRENDDNETIAHRRNDDGPNDRSNKNESDQVRALELQLEIEKVKLQQMQITGDGTCRACYAKTRCTNA
jgi:hypothetical protein